ncbi:MAG: methyltransferase domain-containing protein [Candidatus Dormibacteraeota bacterium]|nr:methyltransferase domain-containing protein [Candidatus Dormibacteraeota bacterium]
MNYERAVDHAGPSWRHFGLEDLERLPRAVREHEMRCVPKPELDLLAARNPEAMERVRKAFFWTLVYHLEPDRWDALAQIEPIHPQIVGALPSNPRRCLDIGAGSGRLTQHLVARCRHVVAVEPASGLRARLKQRLPAVATIAGWADALPLADRCSDLTTACGALGPEPGVISELERVTATGGVIALISPEFPEWFEAHGWTRVTAAPIAVLEHEPWIDDFFGPPESPHELLTKRMTR